MQGQDVVPLVRHVLILLLRLGQGQQLDGGRDGEGVGGLDREPAGGPGGVGLTGGGEHQVTVLDEVLCHNSLDCHALERKSLIFNETYFLCPC